MGRYIEDRPIPRVNLTRADVLAAIASVERDTRPLPCRGVRCSCHRAYKRCPVCLRPNHSTEGG
jgi:hypothetical protein